MCANWADNVRVVIGVFRISFVFATCFARDSSQSQGLVDNMAAAAKYIFYNEYENPLLTFQFWAYVLEFVVGITVAVYAGLGTIPAVWVVLAPLAGVFVFLAIEQSDRKQFGIEMFTMILICAATIGVNFVLFIAIQVYVRVLNTV